MIVNMTALDVDKLYNEGHAHEFARIARIKDPNFAAQFFITMKTIVLIYVHDMQFQAQHDLLDRLKKIKAYILHLESAICVAKTFPADIRQTLNIQSALKRQIGMDNGAQFSDGLTARFNVVNVKREPRWNIKGYPSIDGSQQLLFHGGAGKILDLSDDIVEGDIGMLYSILQKYYEVENDLRKSRSSRSRSSAFRKTIVLLRKEYESFSGKRATLSNTGAGKGASGSFNDLAEAVLRPVLLLSPYWKHRRLESVIRSVLYAKSNKKRRNSKKA